jgi:branched-chain amino acid transport system substrate-binding protein
VPQAYAQMQVVEQAIAGTSSLDDKKLANFTRNNSFDTVVGQVRFGAGGGWAQPRVLQVQYQNIRSNEVDAFKNSNTQTVVWPEDLASGDLIYPFSKSRG